MGNVLAWVFSALICAVAAGCLASRPDYCVGRVLNYELNSLADFYQKLELPPNTDFRIAVYPDAIKENDMPEGEMLFRTPLFNSGADGIVEVAAALSDRLPVEAVIEVTADNHTERLVFMPKISTRPGMLISARIDGDGAPAAGSLFEVQYVEGSQYDYERDDQYTKKRLIFFLEFPPQTDEQLICRARPFAEARGGCDFSRPPLIERTLKTYVVRFPLMNADGGRGRQYWEVTLERCTLMNCCSRIVVDGGDAVE